MTIGKPRVELPGGLLSGNLIGLVDGCLNGLLFLWTQGLGEVFVK